MAGIEKQGRGKAECIYPCYSLTARVSIPVMMWIMGLAERGLVSLQQRRTVDD